MTHSALYRGEVMHARHDALARRAFRYNVYVAALDLDELPALDRELRLFSRAGRTPFGFRERDYGDGTTDDLRASLAAICAANGLPAPHTTRLVTNLRTFGYVFNPVSFFLNYDRAGALDTVIAEVNNTYGGRFRYVLGPQQRVGPELDRSIGRPAKQGWPSPYNEGPPERGPELDRSIGRPAKQGWPSPYNEGPPERGPELDRSIGRPAKQGWPSPYNEGPPERGPELDRSIGRPAKQGWPSPYNEGPPERGPELDRSIGRPAKQGWPSPYNEGPPERGPGGPVARFRHIRELFVSPFLHGEASYDFSFDAPLDGERLAIDMHVEHEAGRSFTARLSGARAALSDRTLVAAAVRYPFMTAQVIGLIHWQAIKLRWLGVPYRRPGIDHRPLRVQPERR